jgi:hypothetical protein
MLSAVANSRNSFPFSSRLRTNTGIAKGSRVHFRRSFSGLRRIKVSSLSPAIYTFWVASNGPNVDIEPPSPWIQAHSPIKRGFLHRIERFCPIFPFFFLQFQYPIAKLLKSAMIYPTVAILVHFH